MTDAEIIKAHGCCCIAGYGGCRECPCRINETTCIAGNGQLDLAKAVLDLLNRQQEMIDALIAGQETLQKALAEKNAEIERLLQKLQQPQSEASNEFSERLNKKLNRIPQSHFSLLIVKATVEEVRKEMEAEHNESQNN